MVNNCTIMRPGKFSTQGLSSEHLSVQESASWKYFSFLALIAGCQDGGRRYRDGQILSHTGTRDCPQGCNRVHLDQLHVPERLQCYNPLRRHEDKDEEDDNNDSVQDTI